MTRWQYVITLASVCFFPHIGFAADVGLITKQSNHSVAETIQRFEAGVNASSANGWMVFTEIDHAEAAQKCWVTRAALHAHRVRKPEAGYFEHATGRNACNRCSAKSPCLGR